MKEKRLVNNGLDIIIDKNFCLTTSRHYLNRCWLEIIGIHPCAICQKMCKICMAKLSFKIESFYASTRGQCINHWFISAQLKCVLNFKIRRSWFAGFQLQWNLTGTENRVIMMPPFSSEVTAKLVSWWLLVGFSAVLLPICLLNL